MKKSTKKRGFTLGVGAASAAVALALTLGVAPAAQATGMAAVTGSISCNNLHLVGTSASAKGRVQFQLNSVANLQMFADLGSSSAWAPWGWKWWVGQAKEFYAYGFDNGGVTGDARSASRYCQLITS